MTPMPLRRLTVLIVTALAKLVVLENFVHTAEAIVMSPDISMTHTMRATWMKKHVHVAVEAVKQEGSAIDVNYAMVIA